MGSEMCIRDRLQTVLFRPSGLISAYIIVGLPELDLHLRLIGLVVGSFNLNGISGRADLCKRASMED